MRRLLAPLALLALLPAPAAGEGQGLHALAAGTLPLVVRDPATGAVVCEGGAAFEVDAEGSGPFASVEWQTFACEGALPAGMRSFGWWCPDACVSLCAFSDVELSCGRPWLDAEMRLSREGSFRLRVDGPQGRVEAGGELPVLAWRAAPW